MIQEKKVTQKNGRIEARVVLDAKEAVHGQASPKQSPDTGEEIEDVEEKSKDVEKDKGNSNY